MQTPSSSAPRTNADPNKASASTTGRRRRTPIIVAVFLLLVLGTIWWVNHRHAAQNPGGPQGRRGGRGGFAGMYGPLPVTVKPAERGDIAIYLNGLGTVTPAHVVTVRSQISGHLEQIAFKEGQYVHEGDLLAVIDPRPYEVALKQAQGQLAQAESQLKTAELDLERYQTLAKEDSIAKQQVDTAQSQVNQYRGLAQVYQAAIDNANLNLTYCHIKAPMDGRVGLRQVDVGNYVTPGDANGIVVLSQTKPITVIFTLPEDNMGPVAARLNSGAKLPVTAIDRTQTKTLATGMLEAMDNQIDPSTGTFKLRASFTNENESLFPNQFVNIQLLLDTLHDVTVIPTSAVERGQQGSYVYVVQPDNTVVARDIKLGQAEGERAQVTSGLEPGDRVVTDGADKLKDGMKVIVHGANEPSGSGAPAAGGNGAWHKRNGGQGNRGGAEGGQWKRKRQDSSNQSGAETPKQ